MSSAAQPSADRWKILSLLTLTLLFRGRVTEYLRQSLSGDWWGYLDMARNLNEYGTLGWGNDPHQPLAIRPPLYVWLLRPCAATYSFAPLVTGVLQVLLALVTVWAIWRLALRWKLSDRAALLAAGLVAFDPILAYETAQVTPITLAACLSVLALHALTSLSEAATIRNAVVAALCLAMCGLCEPAYLLWIAVVVVVMLAAWLRQVPRAQHIWRTALALVMVTASLLAIWPIRNASSLGYATPLTTRSGSQLLRGNNPQFYEFLTSGPWGEDWNASDFRAAWRAETAEVSDSDAQVDRLAYRRALANIADAPHWFAYGALVKLGWLWGLSPRNLELDGVVSAQGAQIVCGLTYALEFVLALFGLWALGRNAFKTPWLFGLLLLGCYTLALVPLWCNMLDRGPLMPVVCLLAAAGAAHVAGRSGSIETVESEDLAPLESAANLP